MRRAQVERWLEEQQAPQLVLVRYSAHHNVNFEWVYNRADIMHAHVSWARDLGADRNRLLLQQLPSRTVWSLEADKRDSPLVPYSDTKNWPPDPSVALSDKEQGQLDW
jgi:hypothetical protein